MKLNVAIPSYKRSNTIKEKTLAMLEKYEVDPNVVTIFVANNEELGLYQDSLKDNPYKNNIVVGVPGMKNVRNFIREYYDEGEFIVNFDDDLDTIMRKSPANGNKKEPIENIHKELFEPMFEQMAINNNKLCGVYAASNALFMSYEPKVGLYYCIGSCWSNINDKHPDRMVEIDDKEDYQRSIQHFDLDGSVSRLDNLTVISQYYTEDGGMQVERTNETIEAGADFLVNKYPDLCTKYFRKTTGHAEIKLKDKSGGKYKRGVQTLENFFS